MAGSIDDKGKLKALDIAVSQLKNNLAAAP